LRRSYFGNHAVSVGNKHRFAACGKANVFAQPVLEHFETDRPHLWNSSYQKLHLSTPPPRSAIRDFTKLRKDIEMETIPIARALGLVNDSGDFGKRRPLCA
jgi:hypothetical protein